ncbi:MAG: TetR/AcrR family transcriptional regulator [Anaerolineae bacterium]|nr:TetR/AcrR family transcriptional regulator [Anaerolineae bacterium]
MTKRQYRGTAQKEVAARTHQRILEATIALAADHWVDEITLEQIAGKAGVTAQTILRHFGSKDGLAAAAARLSSNAVTQQRNEAVAGDLDNIVANLVEHYEQVGDRVFRTLAQEELMPQLKEFLQEGRNFHRQWVERVFETWLRPLDAVERERRTVQLIAACDVYVWKLLRRDLALSIDAYRQTLTDMLMALLNRVPGE